jgi:5-methylcytosine-specific restriction endonuclease McrA
MKDDERVVRELVATGKWSDEQARIGLRAHFRCEYCGLDFHASPENYKQWEREHVVPLSADEGTETFDNLAAACRTCNYFKGSWNPGKHAGKNATRTALIAAGQSYIRERKQLTEQQIAREKVIIERP